jgi:CBS domain-containing protein
MKSPEGVNMTDPLASDQNDSYDDDRESPGEILDTALGDVPRRKAVLVEPNTKVAQVISLMNEKRTGCALVVDDGGRLVGIFTERDILQKMAGTAMSADSIIVKELMTPRPDTLPEDASVAFAINRMSVEGYRHIPILDEEGRALGVIGMRDILNWMADSFPERILNQPPIPSSFPRKPEGG